MWFKLLRITRYKLPLLVGGFVVFAITVAVFAIEEEHLIHIFPTNVSSEGWMKKELALEQDLGGQATVEDFTRENSSFVIFTQEERDEIVPIVEIDTENVPIQEENVPIVNDVEETLIDESDSVEEAPSDEEEDILEREPIVDTPVQTEEPLFDDEEVIEPLPDISMLEYLIDVSRGFVGHTVRAQEESTAKVLEAENTEPVVEEIAETSTVVDEESQNTIDSITDEFLNDTEIFQVPPETTVTNNGESIFEESTGEISSFDGEDEADSVEGEVNKEYSAEEIFKEDSDDFGAENIDDLSEDDVRVCHVLGTDCYTEQFSGFDIGSVLSEQTVTGYTLKASLAAKSENGRFTDDKVLVRYFYKGRWHLAGEIAIKDTVSNFENGGHFSFALPNLQGWDALNTFKVEFEFVRQSNVRTEFFLDSVWVETTFRSDDDMVSKFPDNVLQDLAEIEQLKRGDLLRTEEGVIPLPYVNNEGGDLTIRSSVNILESPGTGDVYLSVTNIGTEKKDFNLSFYMPDEESEPQALHQLMYNIPFEYEVVDTGSLAQYCESGWVQTDSNEEGGVGIFFCPDTDQNVQCDGLNEDASNCIQNEVEIGRHIEIEYTEGWNESRLQSVTKKEEDDAGLLNRVRRWFTFKKQPTRESVMTYASEDIFSIAPNQTLYFSVRMQYPQVSEGGFAVEVTSDDIPSALDIAWKSNWRYRLPVEIHRDTISNTRTLELSAEENPHLFAHVSDWSYLFIREADSHQASWVPYTHTVIDAEHVELSLKLSDLPKYAEKVYLYYGGQKDVEMKPMKQAVASMPDTKTDEAFKEEQTISSKVLGYTLGVSEEVILDTDKDNRVVTGLSKDGLLTDDGKIVFAYRTNRKELHRDGFAEVPKKSTFAIEKVILTHEGDGEVPDISFTQTVGNEWELDTKMSERALKPGKYTLEIEIVEGDRVYAETKEFYWGVLTWNSTKSVYAQDETVEMHMATLSNSGNTICRAILKLSIQNPLGEITQVPIASSEECDGNNVTEDPDYRATLHVSEIGTYNVLLQHLGTEGEVLNEIEEKIIVEPATPYVIERVGPTRINPTASYTMTLRISTSDSFSGSVQEILPEFFEVSNFNTADTYIEDGVRVLSWDVSITSGEVVELSYTFDAPDISPYIYLLGPASLGSVFTESRAWQVASDATGNMLLFWDGTVVPTGWTCVSCTSGDVFYQRFIMGSSTYNVTGGATTHTHTGSSTVFSGGTGSTESQGSGVIEVVGHTHTYSPTFSAGSNVPPYRQLRVIQYNSAGEPASIPTGAIAIFDATVPTGWTRYSTQDGSFIYGENTSGTTGGNATHQHTLSGSTGASVGDSTGSRGGGTQADGATDAHTHTVSGATGNVSNEPPYIGVILGQLDATTTPPNSMISMWTDEVPFGWVTLSSSTEPFENKFIKPGATYGGTGGASSHTHVDISGLTSSLVGGAASRSGSSGVSPHSHSVSVTGISNVSNLPPYATAVFGKRFSTSPMYTQENYRFFVNGAFEPPTDPWPLGAIDLAENARITTTDHTVKGDVVRIRMSVGVTNATSTAGVDKFTLQYAPGSTCSDAGLVWTDVAPLSSTTAPWRGYDNNGIADGSTLSSTTLSTSNVFETYEEENYSASTTNDIAPGDVGEWDWVVEHNEASAGTDYCFRMAQSNGTIFSVYKNYPQLITNEAPVAPTLITVFDSEKTASTSPIFTFYSTDTENDSIQYQIQVDDDYSFGSPVIDSNSIDTPSQFGNIDNPADKSPFNSGDRMKYTPSTSLTDTTTYWWRVRGRDTGGSDQWGEWSELRSFTVDTSVTISTWFQTTDEQFDQDTLSGAESNGTDQVVLITGSSTGSIVSRTIDFDWGGGTANAWGYLRFVDVEPVLSDLTYQVLFYDESDGLWKLIPDLALSGNSTGFDTSPVSLLGLDTTTYRQIRVQGNLTSSGSSPLLSDWTVEWGTRVQQPTLSKLFDNEKTGTTTPAFEFTTTDPQDEDLVYEISWSTDYTFVSGVVSRVSDTHVGFQNLSNVGDTSPFDSGDNIRFTIQSGDALTNNTTYWWRVRAKDPTGGDTWSDWSKQRSFTVDTSVVASTWFQTTNEQFDRGGLFGLTTLANSVQVATSVKDVLLAYGEGISVTPKYRFWNGTSWGTEYSALSVGAPQYWVITKAHPTAEVYALATLGNDADVNVQIYKDGTWDNLQEMTTTISNTNTRGVDMAYETLSGDLLVVYCDGDADPSYRTYNQETGWSTAGAINLSSTNNCEWIRLASDPTSDEIVLVSLDAGGSQYEAQIWNGSTWGNATVLGSMFTSGNEGIGLMYEESGGQAMVVVSDGRMSRFRYNSWNGSTWAGVNTYTIGDDLEWASLKRDKGTDAMALCYIDLDSDIGVVHWTGSAWTSQTEIELSGNSIADRPIDCEYETSVGRDGYVLATYSDDTNARYQSWNGATWSAEGSVSSITDASTVQTVRSDDGLILAMFFDDVNGRYDFSYWNGSSWSSAQTLENSPSVTGSPYGEPFMMAPRNSAISGTLYSPAVDYSEGTGPQWNEVVWSDSEPGGSTLTYQVQYYDTASSTWKLVADSLIAGNSVGTSTSPISISGLNKSTYNTLRIKANSMCVSGNCPVMNDWTVTWSEGFTVSGIAKQFDQTTNVTSGTVAVAVNGLLQVGKTGTISGGVWTINNINAFQNDVLTFWIDGANEANRAVAVTIYDGDGSITGVDLYERHLSIGSDDNPTVSNSDLSKFDNSVSGDEDIFFDVDGNNDLFVCESGQITCGSERLLVRSGSTFQPSTSTAETIHTHDVDIQGTLVASGNTFEVSGSWKNTGIFQSGTSIVIFDATSTTENIDSVGATTGSFNTVTFGQGVSTATWTLSSLFDVNGDMTLASGMLAPGAGYQITLAGNLTIGTSGGFAKAVGTTTFDGTGVKNWSDASSPLQDMGLVIVDGTSKTVSLTSNVHATKLEIGVDDILALGTHTLDLSGSFNNTGSLVAQTGTVLFTSTNVGNTINGGSSSFYNLSFNGSGGNWAFPNGKVTVINDVEILNGIVTMPNGTSTIGGSFTILGGQCIHNNGLVYFNSNLPETITVNNSLLFDIIFNGNGSWTFLDTNATSSNEVTLTRGTVVMPSGTFAIGGSMNAIAGTFTHSSGAVRFYSSGTETIKTNNSNFYNLQIDGTGDFTLSDTNLTVSNNIIMQNGNTTFPSGTLTIQGSLNSVGGTFAHNNADVLFSANTVSNTITVNGSDFNNVTFNNVSGGWTLNDSVTSVNDWFLTNAYSFTAPNGGTVEVGGLFSNAVGGASTTWTNSVLYLNSGNSQTINTKTDNGDVYNTLQIGADTDVSMWNSSATSYSVDTTSSLYSQDHNEIDGDLYIWGTYHRIGGTENWSWATDFDGVDLSGGNERGVNVRFADGAYATITSATLNIKGTTTASTTINNQGSGTFNVIAEDSILDAQYYSFNNLSSTGFTITGLSTISELRNGAYTLGVNSGTLMRVSSSTIDANPALQIFNFSFATTSLITGYNVGVIGVPSSYWTFNDHGGGLDGEDFDDDPGGNPGNVRWNNSSFLITISGNVYDENGAVSTICDNSTQVIFLKVNGAGTYSSSCTSGSGAYAIPNVTFSGNAVITGYIKSTGTSGAVVTKNPNTNITDFHFYEHRVVVRHEDVSPLTISSMTVFDNDDDADVPFTATFGSPSTLVLEPSTELFIWNGKGFTPGGNVTLVSGGSGEVYDGTLSFGTSSVFTALGSETHTIGGSWIADVTSTFVRADSEIIFNASVSGQKIAPANPFNDIAFNGVGGVWSIASSTTVRGEVNLANGTVTGSADFTVYNGPITGNGTFNMSGGTVTVLSGNNFGGNTDWTFNNLIFSTSTATTTTKFGQGDITIHGVLTIGPNHTLQAGSVEWFFSGSGTVLIPNGVFVPQTSTTTFNGPLDILVPSVDYYVLNFEPSSGNPTYTIEAGNFQVASDMMVGGGASLTVTANTNDPLITILGDISIASNATYQSASNNDLFVGGSFTNKGTFSSNAGGILFNSDDSGETIDAGGSAFHHIYFINETGGWTILEDVTATGNFVISSSSDWTLSSGKTLEVQGMFTNYVGGLSTTWDGSILYLNSGTSYNINTSQHSGDTYGTISVGANTDIRVWHSTSTTYIVNASASLYSQDHNTIDGDLYIFGDYVRSVGNDYWSYAVDFDGTDLAGGNERKVDVYIRNGGNVTLSGGTLQMLGATTATTSITNQGSGTYGFDVNGGALTANYYALRDMDAAGLHITGSPTITSLSYGDFELAVNGGTLITVAASAISANQLRIMYNNRFATSSGALTGTNVTATGVTGSSWRFTSHYGGLDGELYNVDPGGDPGYIIWDNSAAQIKLSGNVLGTDEFTVSTVCDGSTQVIRFLINGANPKTTSCNAGTGHYEFADIVYNVGDVFTVYLKTNGGAKAVNVTVDPITNINDMHLYENRVIVRHESSNPLTIEDLDAYDSDQDTDIPYDADIGSPSTFILNSGSKLIVWDNKTLAPGGNVTVSSLGNGTGYDGTIELKDNAGFIAAGTETHTIGGSFISGSSATLTSANSNFVFTATTTGKTIDTNTSSFANVTFNGTGGGWTFLESNATSTGDITITNGDVTLATSSFAVGGSFINNDSFTGTTTIFRFTGGGSKVITFNGYEVGQLVFTGDGTWTMTDTHATSTDSVHIEDGSVLLPTGIFSVKTDFTTSAGASFNSRNGTLLLYGAESSKILSLASSSLANLTIYGSGSWIFADSDATTTGSIHIQNGGLTAPSGSLAVGASLTSSSTFNTNAGTLYFYATSTSKIINTNGAILGSVIFDGLGGGWTIASSSTSTAEWRMINGASFTMATGTTLEVGGIFENTIGGSATQWTDSLLYLNASGTTFSINTKADTGDEYAHLSVGVNTKVSMWHSSGATTTVDSTSYLYSQDHAGNDGDLYIFGTYEITSGNEYWNYATDFDGTALGGSSRSVDVRIASGTTVSLLGGTLNIVGSAGATTTVDTVLSGEYTFEVSGGTLNAQYYKFAGMDEFGLQFSNSPSITTLNNGAFELGQEGGSMVTVSSSTINNNPSRTFDGLFFSTTTGISSGFNILLTGTTNNIWQFTNHSGNYDGEDYDSDGLDACGQIRWSDSACLEVAQTHYRFRNDDGGEGSPSSEWYDTDWNRRKIIKINNVGKPAVTNYAFQVDIPYDSDMQADFDDVRFTDSSGTTSLSYWFEDVQLSATATAWVKIPTLLANTINEIYVYYDNALAVSGENGSNTFTFFDDFEDNSISEYSGSAQDLSYFSTNASFNWEGSYGLSASGGNTDKQTSGGIYRTGTTFSQGSTIRFFQKTTAGTDDEPCTLFGVQGSGQNYAVCLDQYPTDRLVISQDVTSNSDDGTGTELASTAVTWTTGWYEIEIDWLTDDSIDVTVYDSTGTEFATLSTSDGSYDSGGMGFSFWYQSEGWDFYTVRPYVASDPSYTIGLEQVDGGASWKAEQDTSLIGQAPNENFRLRTTIENTGTQITGQSWRLQYAPKSVYSACEGVPSVDYNDVPNVSSCGVSPVCMTTSSNLTDQEVSTEHLNTNLFGTFVNGHVVESPSNQTNTMTLEQNEYTEIEYSLEFTDFAVDSNYCMRSTNGGIEVDTYLRIAEASVRFSPVISNWSLNSNKNISLMEGETQTIYATGTVSDLNGFSDLLYATTTIYRSGVTHYCDPDDNNCYRLSSFQCPFTNCSGNSCDVECSTEMQYFADPTDVGSVFESEKWEAHLYVLDATSNESTSTSDGVEMQTLRALSVTSGEIDYGELGIGQDTGGTNPTTILQNTGNDSIDIELAGTDLSAPGSAIPVANQIYATSSFTYSSCVICSALSGIANPYEVDLVKPTSATTPVTEELYWGVYVPVGTGGSAHFGQNTFYATGD